MLIIKNLWNAIGNISHTEDEAETSSASISNGTESVVLGDIITEIKLSTDEEENDQDYDLWQFDGSIFKKEINAFRDMYSYLLQRLITVSVETTTTLLCDYKYR